MDQQEPEPRETRVLTHSAGRQRAGRRARPPARPRFKLSIRSNRCLHRARPPLLHRSPHTHNTRSHYHRRHRPPHHPHRLRHRCLRHRLRRCPHRHLHVRCHHHYLHHFTASAFTVPAIAFPAVLRTLEPHKLSARAARRFRARGREPRGLSDEIHSCFGHAPPPTLSR